MNGNLVVPAPLVDLTDDDRISRVVKIEHSVLPKSHEEILKIFHTVDPVQFLADIIAGKAIPCHIMTDKGLVTAFETPDLRMRERVARYIVDKYIPKVAVVKHAHLHAHVDGSGKPTDSEMTFAQIVAKAARNSEVPRERPGESVPVLEAEPS